MSKDKKEPTSARDCIKAADDRPRETVPLPEFGIALVARGMSAADSIALAALGLSGQAYTQELVARCLCDEAGTRIYANAEEAAEFLDKSMPVVRRVIEAIHRVNGKDTAEEKKD